MAQRGKQMRVFRCLQMFCIQFSKTGFAGYNGNRYEVDSNMIFIL